MSWMPLMEYAMKKGVSLSTLRRYIKSYKVQYKVEGGRYMLFDEAGNSPMIGQTGLVNQEPAPILTLHLSNELQKAKEEIAELKMLIALYEEKNSSHRFNN